MSVWMGIDGGGTQMRLALIDSDRNVIAYMELTETTNPNIVGHDASMSLIQAQMRAILAHAHHPIVFGVGVGISGASAEHSADWLCAVVRGVLPDATIAPSSDIEIALVGAHGRRYGILLLAGTGSVAIAIGEDGTSLQVGGWGYLLGDKGSGYWLGMQALETFTFAHDGRLPQPSSLTKRVQEALHLEKGRALVQWLYQQHPIPISEVAKLARIVLEEAEGGDWKAQAIIADGASELASLVQVGLQGLHMPDAPIAFAGGLLSEPNPLSRAVMAHLNLSTFPQALYSPVIGAALLAQIMTTQGKM